MASFELVGVQAVVEGLDSFVEATNEITQQLREISGQTLALDNESRSAWTNITRVSEDFFVAFAAGAFAITTSAAAIIAGVETIGAKFNETLAGARVDISTTDEDMQRLSATVLDAGSKFGIGLGDLGQATAALRQSGVSLQDINEGALKATTDLAVATGGGPSSLASAVRATAEVMHVFNINGRDMQSAANFIAGAVDNSTINLQAFGQIMAQLGPTAQDLGFSFRDVATTVAEMGKSGQSAFTIANSLTQAFARLANPTATNLTIMKELGLSIQDTNGNIVDMRTFIGRLSDALSGASGASAKLTAAQRLQDIESLFGTRATRGLVTVIEGGTKAFDDMAKTLDGTNVEKVAEQFQLSLAPQLEITKNLLQTLIIQGSEPLARSLTTLSININSFLRTLNPDIPKAFGDAIAAIVTGQEAADLKSTLDSIFGTGLGGDLNSLVEIARTARNVFLNELVPAIAALGKALFEAFGGSKSVATTLNTLSASIHTISADVISFIHVLTGIAQEINKSQVGVELFRVALDALIALPVVGFVAIITSIGGAFLSILAPIAAVALGIGVLYELLTKVGAGFDGSISSILVGLSNLSAAETIVAGVTLGLAAKFAVDLIGGLFAATAGVRGMIAASFELAASLAGALDIALTTVTAAMFRLAAAAIATIAAFDFGAAIAALVSVGPIVALLAVAVAAASVAIRNNFLGMGDAWEKLKNFIEVGIQGLILAFNDLATAIGIAARVSAFDLQIMLESSQVVKDGVVSGVDTQANAFDKLIAEYNRLAAEGAASDKAQADNFSAMVSQIQKDSEIYQRALASDSALYDEWLRRQSISASQLNAQKSGGPGFPDLEKATSTSGPKLEVLVKMFEALLSDIPGAGRELAKFLAQLEQATPGRASALVAALESAKGIIDQMVISASNLAVINKQVAADQATITSLQQANAAIDLSLQQQTLGARQAVLSLQIQQLQIDQQATGLELQALEIQQQMLPLQQEVAAVQLQITNAQREDYGLIQQIAAINLQELPVKQQIAALERQINGVINERLALQEDIATTQAQSQVGNLSTQLAIVNSQLDAAWKTMNVPAILAAEAQQRLIQSQLDSANLTLTIASNTQSQTQDQNKIAQDNLKLQEQVYVDQLSSLDAIRIALQDQQDLAQATSAVVVAGLNQQLQAVNDLLAPLQAQLTATQNNIAATQLQTAMIAVQIKAIQDQIDIQTKQADIRKLQIDVYLLQAQAQLVADQGLQTQEKARFEALVAQYVNALVASGAYTLGEAGETAKRLSFIDSQILAWVNDAISIAEVQAAADALHRALDDIPKDVIITITTVHKDIYDSSLPQQTASGKPFDEGGVVPGPFGVPRIIVAHGGEQFLGVGQRVPTSVAQAGVGATSSPNTNQSNTYNTYNISPTYMQPQDVGSITQDLRAIVAMTHR